MQQIFLPRRIAARWSIGKLSDADWPATARDALQAGFDGPALRRLASLEKADHWDVRNYVEQALREMGASRMSQKEALVCSAEYICRDILDEVMDPFVGAGEIWRDMLRLKYFPKELASIFDEIETEGTGLLPGGEPEARQRILSHALAYLRQQEKREGGPPPVTSVSFFESSGVRLHAVLAGPEDGPVVMLLHGFPEFWYGWRKQIEPLAAAGFRVIVPDQRGYNLSGKPRGVASYALAKLVSDVIAIADQLGQQKIFLAGHDWGAAVAWSAALLHPERIAKLGVLNVPHPSVMRRYVYTRLPQMLRSWYIFLFQIPRLPEALLSTFNFRAAARALLGSSRLGTFSAEDLAQYRAAWSQPGALTAMINWYRAAIRYRIPFPDRTVRVPTRILWGERDRFLMAEMAHESLHYCTNGELFTFADASHWLQHEEAERVSQLLVQFFRS